VNHPDANGDKLTAGAPMGVAVSPSLQKPLFSDRFAESIPSDAWIARWPMPEL
jgi:hypothetical protein